MTRGLLLGLAVLSGCDLSNGMLALDAPDRAAFEAEAGPILAERCGAVQCHGNAERPFNLYSIGNRRRPPLGTYSHDPLTPLEHDANYKATLGFLDAERARETTLLRKALGVGGSGGHGGGAVFEAASDPECRAVRAWIEESP